MTTPKVSTPAHKYPIFRISLLCDIEIRDLYALRGAISKIAGPDHVLFHNHYRNGKLRYQYPLIQYRWYKDYPLLVCLGEGVVEVQHFFQSLGPEIDIRGEMKPIKVGETWFSLWPFNVWENVHFRYTLKRWIPLNDRNYKTYIELANKGDRQGIIDLLQPILIGNILSMARGIEWNVTRQIKVKITDIWRVGVVRYKNHDGHNITKTAFNIDFTTNVYLPYYIGLGQKVSIGFGNLEPPRKVPTIDKVHIKEKSEAPTPG